MRTLPNKCGKWCNLGSALRVDGGATVARSGEGREGASKGGHALEAPGGRGVYEADGGVEVIRKLKNEGLGSGGIGGNQVGFERAVRALEALGGSGVDKPNSRIQVALHTVQLPREHWLQQRGQVARPVPVLPPRFYVVQPPDRLI